MSTPVVTTAGTAACTHAGPVTLSASAQLLTVAGAFTLSPADVTGASVGCAVTPDPNTGLTTCVTTKAPSSGISEVLLVGGDPVVLAGAAGPTSGFVSTGVSARFTVSKAGQTLLVAS